jgi:hypothetical protein
MPKRNEDQTAIGGIKLDHQLTQDELDQFFPGHKVFIAERFRETLIERVRDLFICISKVTKSFVIA